MKKLVLPILLFLSFGAKSQIFNFTITNVTGSNSITCTTPSIVLTASPGVSFNWASPSFTSSAATVTLTSPGSYTVTVSNGTLSSAQIVTIGVNTVVPVSAVNPTFQSISCGNSIPPVTLTAVSPTVNVTHYVHAALGGSFVANSTTIAYQPPPGTHTYVLVDNVNGCSTSKQFTVSPNPGYPFFNIVSSPPNFTLGCSTKSVINVNIINVLTSPIPGGSVTYTFLSPGSSSIINPGPSSNISINVPGTWTAVVKDVSNQCETRLPFTVIQNTIPPALAVSVPTNVLNCDVPLTVLQASSTSTNVNYVWNYPGIPGTAFGSTFAAVSNSLVPTSTLVANYTLTIIDNNNLCKSTTVVPIYQNLFPPTALIGSAGPSELTCATPTLTLFNQSLSNIPNGLFPTPQPVVGYVWNGPLPQTPATLSSIYVAAVPGVYTLVVKDLNNGCFAIATKVVSDNRFYPMVNNPSAPPPSCLNGGTATLWPLIWSTSNGITFTWTTPAGALASGINSVVLLTNVVGIYTVAASYPNGCITTVTMSVVNCTAIEENNLMQAQVFPNPNNGLFTIAAPERVFSKIEIYNSLGALIKTRAVNSETETIDLRQQANGLYILKLIHENGTVSFSRVLKQ